MCGGWPILSRSSLYEGGASPLSLGFGETGRDNFIHRRTPSSFQHGTWEFPFVTLCRPIGTSPPSASCSTNTYPSATDLLHSLTDPGPNLVVIAARYSTSLFRNSKARSNSHDIQPHLTPLENRFCLQLLCPPDFTGYPCRPTQSIHRFRSKTQFFQGHPMRLFTVCASRGRE